MNISIAFSGPAGGGVNTAGLMLAELLTQKGYKILVDKEYASIIKGDNNSIIVYTSDNIPYISKTLDYFICFDDYSITKNEKIYNLKNIINLKSYKSKYKNIPAFGCALKILGLDLKEGEKILPDFFNTDLLEINKEELKNGYTLDIESANSDSSLTENRNISVPLFALAGKRGGGDLSTQKLFYGNEILAKGAIASGLDFYSAYPMTPASTIIDEITKEPKVTFFQGEDEIAVSISMLGAKFAGKRAMCGTSGGGFALMTESISFSNQTEIGGLYILSQRDGPSTGTPTFTGQGDIDFALNSSFGETYPIVLYPDTFEKGYNLIGKALNRSDIYQHPVILMTDKQFSETYISIDPKKLNPAKIDRGELTSFVKGGAEGGGFDFARYSNTKSGISPYTIPGTENGEFIATSYEHDQYGATNEDPVIKKQMVEKRSNKIKTFIQQEFNEDFYGYEIINPKAKKFFISFGFNRYTLEDYIKNTEYGVIIVTIFQPLDPRLKQRFTNNEKQIEELTFVEMNHKGQFQKLISNECNLKSQSRESKIKNIRKIDLYPIFKEDIK